MLFSQRMGYKPIKVDIQIKSMDDDLRNSLWNVVYLTFGYDVTHSRQREFDYHVRLVWARFFKKPIDTIPNLNHRILEEIRDSFYLSEWHSAYDFIEFLASIADNNSSFTTTCNVVLEQENSAYRFINDTIAPITSHSEINEISEAIKNGRKTKLSPVATHLETALILLSDRKKPDYRNSIKESISAVESISKILSDKPKAELGDALKELEKEVPFHGALKKGFLSIYGYTNDEGGIRHALLDENNVDFEDAKYMLVSCSAFINYLIGKCSRCGMKI